MRSTPPKSEAGRISDHVILIFRQILARDLQVATQKVISALSKGKGESAEVGWILVLAISRRFQRRRGSLEGQKRKTITNREMKSHQQPSCYS